MAADVNTITAFITLARRALADEAHAANALNNAIKKLVSDLSTEVPSKWRSDKIGSWPKVQTELAGHDDYLAKRQDVLKAISTFNLLSEEQQRRAAGLVTSMLNEKAPGVISGKWTDFFGPRFEGMWDNIRIKNPWENNANALRDIESSLSRLWNFSSAQEQPILWQAKEITAKLKLPNFAGYEHQCELILKLAKEVGAAHAASSAAFLRTLRALPMAVASL